MSEMFKFLTVVIQFFSTLLNGGIVYVANKVHEIYELMNKVVDKEELGVHRMCIVRIHNGGGNLSSSKSTYTSVIYEEFRKPLHSVREKYQNVPADKQYMRMLQDIKLNGSTLIETASMPECSLKDILTLQGISRVKYYFLKEKKGGFLWRNTKEMHLATIATVTPEVTLDELAVREEMRQIISDIKRKL